MNTTSSPSPSVNSREAILARIRSESKESVILQEMQRLGFWPAEEDRPDSQRVFACIQQEQALVNELRELNQKLSIIRDPQSALKALRKQRSAEAKVRREQLRQAAEQRRREKAETWKIRQATEVLYLGEEVSKGLSDTETNTDRLIAYGLPVLKTAQEVAHAMGITVPELRFLTFHRPVSRVCHYQRFYVPKRTGGLRLISAPMPRLKRAQHWILDHVLALLPVHESAHGFIRGRSIVTNAGPHVAQSIVINLDLKDFFPSIRYPRVRGLFQSFGYSPQVATLFALLCTELPTDKVEIDGLHFYVQNGVRHLPQGAPSSPMLTNLLCRRLDKRLMGLAQKWGFRYTRYADDMTFSVDIDHVQHLGCLLSGVRYILAQEDFTLHPKKQRIMRASRRQEVTGIVVNHHPTVCRETLHRFRSTVYQVEKDGPSGKHWNGNKDVLSALHSFAHFVKMVDPAKGIPLCAKVASLRSQYASQ